MVFYTKQIILIFAITFLSLSCGLNFKRGNGVIESMEIDTEIFEKVSIGGNYEVILIEGNSSKVIIETDENLLSYINVEQFENTLNINNVHKLKSSDGIMVQIYYKTVNKIYSTGASKITNEGILKSGDMTINLSGAGAIDLEVETDSIKVNLTGAGIITLSGETNIQETHISGAGGLRALQLKSRDCKINLSGLGGAEVFALDKIEATITGVGGIIYAGNPEVIERQITGFGKIKRAEEYFEIENS